MFFAAYLGIVVLREKSSPNSNQAEWSNQQNFHCEWARESISSLTDFKSDIFEALEGKVVRNDRFYPNYWDVSNSPVLSNGLAEVFCIVKENCLWKRKEVLKQVGVLCK